MAYERTGTADRTAAVVTVLSSHSIVLRGGQWPTETVRSPNANELPRTAPLNSEIEPVDLGFIGVPIDLSWKKRLRPNAEGVPNRSLFNEQSAPKHLKMRTAADLFVLYPKSESASFVSDSSTSGERRKDPGNSEPVDLGFIGWTEDFSLQQRWRPAAGEVPNNAPSNDQNAPECRKQRALAELVALCPSSESSFFVGHVATYLNTIDNRDRRSRNIFWKDLQRLYPLADVPKLQLKLQRQRSYQKRSQKHLLVIREKLPKKHLDWMERLVAVSDETELFHQVEEIYNDLFNDAEATTAPSQGLVKNFWRTLRTTVHPEVVRNFPTLLRRRRANAQNRERSALGLHRDGTKREYIRVPKRLLQLGHNSE